jgi:hypothetical protein
MIDTTKALADYADAILAGRRAKNWLFLILLITLVTELTLIFVSHFTKVLEPQSAATTQSTTAGSRVWIQYLLALATFSGLIASLLMAVVLFALTLIMLTVRTLGVGKLTSAFVWSALLLILLFPWQTILAGPTVSTRNGVTADFKVPGVIYTWSEFDHPTLGARFKHDPFFPDAFLRWARFAGMPIVALIILLCVQVKSGKGIRAALGEDQPPVEAGSGV